MLFSPASTRVRREGGVTSRGGVCCETERKKGKSVDLGWGMWYVSPGQMTPGSSGLARLAEDVAAGALNSYGGINIVS